MRLRALVPVAALAVLASRAPAADPPSPLAAFIRETYTKYEHLVPMRDGTRLFTAVYVPKDAGPAKRYPILMIRTPYSVAPYGIDAYPRNARPVGIGGAGQVHLRPPGRPRPDDVGGDVRRRPSFRREGRGRRTSTSRATPSTPSTGS